MDFISKILIGGVIGFFVYGSRGFLLGCFIGGIFGFMRRRPSAKAVGGILGFMFAGPLGAIAGVYFGSAIDSMKQAGSGAMDRRSIFEINLISILAYVAKADGEIHPEEVKVIMRSLGMHPAQLEKFQRTLSFALKQDIDLETTCRDFRTATRYEERLMLLRLVYLVAMADGILHPQEKIAIEQIVRYLEIHEADYLSLQGEFVKTQDRYYQILGLEPGATKAEIKKKYRKSALTHHPDRVAHLGEEYAKIAKEKFQKINEAYSHIMKTL